MHHVQPSIVFKVIERPPSIDSKHPPSAIVILRLQEPLNPVLQVFELPPIVSNLCLGRRQLLLLHIAVLAGRHRHPPNRLRIPDHAKKSKKMTSINPISNMNARSSTSGAL